MHGDIGETDRRAVLAGTLVGAVATVAVTVFAGGTAVGAVVDGITVVVIAGSVASIPAGAVAAGLSRERMQPFREGAYAASVGFLVGVTAWMVLVSARAALPMDSFLLLVVPMYAAASVGFLVSFAVGGTLGHVTLMRGR